MRICILGEHSSRLDEGMRNFAFHLAKELSKNHEVASLDSHLNSILSKSFWGEIKKFDPQIVHYIPGPSPLSFILAKAVAFCSNDAKVIMSAFHPRFHFLLKRVVPLLKPDLILTQTYETEEMFSNLGCKTRFLPSGVDPERFTPVSKQVKNGLRKKYGLDKDKFIVLHVGHITEERGLRILEKLQGGDNQVIIIGSTSIRVDQPVYQALKEKGCFVWRTYFKNVEEIYALSDCYLFPTISRKGSPELPLSVMEAMSCNLPVISTRFGALPRVFDEGDGLFFAERDEDFFRGLRAIKDGTVIRTREKVTPYSWGNIAGRLEQIYSEMWNEINKGCL